jgi:hypothetical protein
MFFYRERRGFRYVQHLINEALIVLLAHATMFNVTKFHWAKNFTEKKSSLPQLQALANFEKFSPGENFCPYSNHRCNKNFRKYDS